MKGNDSFVTEWLELSVYCVRHSYMSDAVEGTAGDTKEQPTLCQSWEPGPQWSGAALAHERDAARIPHLPGKSSRARVEMEAGPVGRGGVTDVPTQPPRAEGRLSAGESLTAASVGMSWIAGGQEWGGGLQA